MVKARPKAKGRAEPVSQRTVTGRQFAQRHGVSHTTVQNWTAEGLVEVDAEGRIPLARGNAAVRKLRRDKKQEGPEAVQKREHEAALLAAELRERVAKAEQREQALAITRGDLVPLKDVREDATAAVEVFRTRLLALPSRLALQLEALAARLGRMPSAPELQAAMADEVSDLLGKLYRSRFVIDEGGGRVWFCGGCEAGPA